MSGKGTGLKHWRAQRLTAMALAPLGLWFVYAIAALTGADYAAIHAWASQPLNALLLALFMAVMLRHALLGVEEVIQDYVHAPCVKYGALMAARIATLVLLAVALIAIAVLAFGG